MAPLPRRALKRGRGYSLTLTMLCLLALECATVTRIFAAEHAAQPLNLPAQPIISRSGQFFVYSPDDNWAVRFVGYADLVRAFVRDSLAVASTAGADSPILVLVHQDNVHPEWRGKSQLTIKPVQGSQTYYMLHLYLPMDLQNVLTGLVEAVALEATNRERQWGKAVPLNRLPLWWVQGAAETFREDIHASQQEMLTRVWNESPPTPVSKLIATRELSEDPLERHYFIAQYGVLFRAVADMHGGNDVMREMLRRACNGERDEDGFRAAMKDMFPTDVGLEKWWALQCAANTRFANAGLMSAEDSLLTLNRLLTFSVDVKNKDSDDPAQPAVLRLEELVGHHTQPDVRWLIREHSTRLRVFATQSHPYYKSAALFYAEALDLLYRGKTRAFRPKLRDADDWRTRAESYDRRAHQWMNEIESELRGDAGGLLPFIEEIGRVRDIERGRTDHIKRYMDEMEKELSP